MQHSSSATPVLAALSRDAGTDYDRLLSGALTAIRQGACAPDVSHLGVPDDFTIGRPSCGAALPSPGVRLADRPIWIEWCGKGDLFRALDSVRNAALIEPISTGFFKDAVSVRFVASSSRGVMPLPGRVIVDVEAHGNSDWSRVDQIRAAYGLSVARGAAVSHFFKMDGTIVQLGEYFVRSAPTADTPAAIVRRPAMYAGWHEWGVGGLEAALSTTLVQLEESDPLVANACEGVARTAGRLFELLLDYGPFVALRLLALAGQCVRQR